MEMEIKNIRMDKKNIDCGEKYIFIFHAIRNEDSS